MGKRKKAAKDEEVTLNVTAMLDMAFQLLAFFVLTFKPPPAEYQIFLKLPPAQKVLGAQGTEAAGNDASKDPNTVKPVKTLTVSLMDDGGGSVTDLRIGVPSIAPLKPIPVHDLDAELRDWIQKQGFEQLIVQFSATLHWEEVMKVVDLCAKLPTKDGKLPELSFLSVGDRKEE
jgi:biopolymer transport protein ExbD